MSDNVEALLTARLAFTLFGAGVTLLLLEVFFANRVFAFIGAMTLLGSAVLAFARISIEVGSLLLLGGATLVSLGFLVVLAFFPGSPLSRRFLARSPEDIPGESPDSREE